MKIIAIDDESLALEDLLTAIRSVEPEAELRGFLLASDALKALEEGRIRPDVVFADIQMPGINGLELAVRLKTLAPESRIVFVTAYSQYAVESYKVRAHGYLLKPITPEKVREELDALPRREPLQEAKLRVRCFGSFEVFWQGRPLEFSRQKTKELLAYLIKEGGAWCSADEIISDLWEDTKDDQSAKGYLRVLTHDLLDTLRPIGMQDLIRKKRGQMAINTEKLDCDYYRMLAGDMEAINAFHGEYMVQYGWAEILTGALYFRNLIDG